MSSDFHKSLYKSTKRAKYVSELDQEDNILSPGIVAKWNVKEKVKTAAAAIVVCLHIGVDPPGHVRISPCPVQHCWMDPISAPNPRALETIGKTLQAQYERWQPRAKYAKALDPTKDEVRKACMTLRRIAKTERVLFHYNGHGVPKPTGNGEIWVFDAEYTQYIPLSVYDLQCWVGNPVMYVLDCPSAGTIINSVKAFVEQATQEEEGINAAMYPFLAPDGDPMKGTIMMAACRENEDLDTDPNFPADLFTSCLTTPIKVALHWLLSKTSINGQAPSFEAVELVPGLPQDRKTPIGELNWIFTAVTDTIAWDVLPSDLFQKLFRQDLLVASLFRNFLLAERVMSSMGVMPISYPRLPPTFNHQMWQLWDLAAEGVIMQLPGLNMNRPMSEFQSSSFFSDQLDSFSLAMKFGSCSKSSTQQLPILLQVLLSPVHRVRALELLCEFLELGTWAVELALSVGVFPYVLKLLQTTAVNLQPTLISIWAKLMALDGPCQSELCRDNGHHYFIRYLESETGESELRRKSAAVLAFACDKNPQAQALCLRRDLLTILTRLLQEESTEPEKKQEMCKWICLCIGKLIDGRVEGITMAMGLNLHSILFEFLKANDPELRAAALFALTSLLLPGHGLNELQVIDLELMEHLASICTKMVYDPSPLVRGETAVLLAFMIKKPGHSGAFEMIMIELQKDAERQSSALQRYLTAVPSSILKPCNEMSVSSATSSDLMHGTDILRWTTEDAAHMHHHHHHEGMMGFDGNLGGLAPDGNQSLEMHRNIIKSLCVLVVDTMPQVASVALSIFQSLDWELEFLSIKKTKYGTPSSSFVETSLQGSLLGPVRTLPRLKSRSKASHDSNAPGSAKSSSSTSSEFPDYQEQTRIFQTRIELATKYAQRRPFRVIKLAKRTSRDTGKGPSKPVQQEPAEQSVPGILGDLKILDMSIVYLGVTRSLLHDVYSAPLQDQDLEVLTESWIFPFCRRCLAEPYCQDKPFSYSAKTKTANKESDSQEDFPKGFQINEKVIHVETQAENIGALLMDAEQDLIAVSDREGRISIHDYCQPTCPEISSFSLTGSGKTEEKIPGMDTVDTVCLFSLNSASSLDCLLACNADGSVRIWEHCLEKEKCNLRSSWQAVPITFPPHYVLTPVCFDLQPESGMLFSAGLSSSGVIYQYDLETETLLQKFIIDKNSHPSIDFLRSYHHNPSLLATSSDDGMIRVFDIRTEHFVGGMRPFPNQGGPISGVCPLTQEKLCVLSYGGHMKMLDIRQTSTSIVSSLVASASIRAHSIGCASALVTHFSKPVLASATLHPVIKIWNLEGEQISSIRPLRSYKEHCQQAVTCMSFHPKNSTFAAAGKGSVCGIYHFTKKQL